VLNVCAPNGRQRVFGHPIKDIFNAIKPEVAMWHRGWDM
jgi:hypothetical protein